MTLVMLFVRRTRCQGIGRMIAGLIARRAVMLTGFAARAAETLLAILVRARCNKGKEVFSVI